jgi:hypothetical protein
VNAGASNLRSRVCSGGSCDSRSPARSRVMSWSVMFSLARRREKSNGFTMLNRWASESTSRTSAYRVTSQASYPNGVLTRAIPARSCSRITLGSGWNSACRHMYAGAVGASVMVFPPIGMSARLPRAGR